MSSRDKGSDFGDRCLEGSVSISRPEAVFHDGLPVVASKAVCSTDGNREKIRREQMPQGTPDPGYI